MLRKVYLHGYLATFHDGPITIVGDTIAEIVEGVTRQVAGFQPDPVKGRHRIKVAGYDTEESLHAQLGPDVEEIHLVPQMSGGKKGGLLQILLGAVLIGVGLLIGAGSLIGSLAMKVGALALLGGVTALLAPKPEADKNNETQNRSHYLGTPKNTVAIGTRIPILYGEHRVFGHFLSFDINAIEYKP
ncbi:tail assembly protein [Ensifer sp. ENS04]|uniref:tail assembly protein n=1 Tax=Ensifer sp. ENS04 TaxID=2769281 RepID=UPI001784251B|nr:tail assembly protein [Ensifer sp. ENS04]MBD9544246.1 tail assembly protein [Ensifer sp. ENS04]